MRGAGSGAYCADRASSLTSMTDAAWAGGGGAGRALRTPQRHPLPLPGPRPYLHAASGCGLETTRRSNVPRAQAPRGPRSRPDAGTPEGAGVTASCSRPRVSTGNPCCESSLRTLKTRHGYPALGFDCEEQARSYIAAAVIWINLQHRPPEPQLRHSHAAAQG